MKILDPGFDLVEFWRRAARAPARVLLLDYDGTLAPFRPEHDLARPWPGVVEALEAILAAPRSRTVVVTGREAAAAARLLGVEPHPEIWGVHGRERLRPGGGLHRQPVPPAAAAALALAAADLRARGHGERLEAKAGALALHWRGLAPAAAAALAREGEAALAAAAAGGAGLELHPFAGGLELRIKGITKGDAVRAVLAEAGPGAAAAFLGDDLTDEDGFAALSGRGLPVLVRPEFRPTAARLWLQPPGELLEFLRIWARMG